MFFGCKGLSWQEFVTGNRNPSTVDGDLCRLFICNVCGILISIAVRFRHKTKHRIHGLGCKFACHRIFRPEFFSSRKINHSVLTRYHHITVKGIICRYVAIIIIRISVFLDRKIKQCYQFFYPGYTADLIT